MTYPCIISCFGGPGGALVRSAILQPELIPMARRRASFIFGWAGKNTYCLRNAHWLWRRWVCVCVGELYPLPKPHSSSQAVLCTCHPCSTWPQARAVHCVHEVSIPREQVPPGPSAFPVSYPQGIECFRNEELLWAKTTPNAQSPKWNGNRGLTAPLIQFHKHPFPHFLLWKITMYR